MNGLTIFERRQNILRLLADQPGLRVADMAEIFQVAEGTIRNDLNALEAEEKLRRVRGGAVLLTAVSAPTNGSPGSATPVSNAEIKERIARWAADTIEDGDTILLDASSTVRFMVPHLQEYKRLTIVTNGLETARLLARTTAHPVVLVGGMVNRSGNATTSLIGLDMLKNLHIRTAYVSCVGFDLQVGLTERLIEEAQLKEAILTSIPRIMALVGSNKIGAVSTLPFAPPERITHLFTDSGVSAEFIEQMRQAKINLTVCGENTVRSFTVEGDRPQFTIGFANQSEELSFAVDVRRSLERAAADLGSINLVVTDNRLSGEEALRVADKLIQRNIDLVIEYQIDYKAGNLIMNKFQQADIPVIAVDIPMVGATFFGVDNYRAGHMAGRALGEWVQERWHGRLDQLLVLEESRAGSLPEARIQGQLDGLQEVLGQLPGSQIQHIDCGNTSAISEAGVADALEKSPDSHQIAVICFNDEAAFGALEAARQANRESDVVIVGQGADRLIHAELRNPHSRLIGSTAYMPERYGEKLMELALKILRGESVPPAVYINHVFINADNIGRYYPAID
ncbi:MAG: substrate-binding domain-containing protein [Ardenticatenaceae bacterium]|nr:substrate-binding domain-containing protein [Ardenticatenaceae bacterium]